MDTEPKKVTVKAPKQKPLPRDLNGVPSDKILRFTLGEPHPSGKKIRDLVNDHLRIK